MRIPTLTTLPGIASLPKRKAARQSAPSGTGVPPATGSPSADSPGKPRGWFNWLLLLIALAIGGAGVFGANRFIEARVTQAEEQMRGKFPTVQVVVPKTDLARGVRVSQENMAIRDAPGEFVQADAVLPARFDVAIGQRLLHPVAAGKPLLWSHLEGGRAPSFSGRLPPGMRAITVPVDEVNSISGFLQPKDKIDLILTLNRDGKRETFPLLQDVPVLATGDEVTAERMDPATGRLVTETFRTATLQVTQEDAKKIILAQDAGRLTAVLRHPDDDAALPRERITVANLVGEGTVKRPVPKPKGPGVHFIIGGH